MSDGNSNETNEDSPTEDPVIVASFRKFVNWWPLTQTQTVIVIFVLFGGGLYLYSGMWPPVYAVESGSMSPNINTGDMVIVSPAGGGVDVDSYDESVEEYHIETQQQSDSVNFGDSGDVIIFTTDDGNVIIHRAVVYVEHGENWIDNYNISDSRTAGLSCESITDCPAPRDGYITHGDSLTLLDQVQNDDMGVISPENVDAKANHRIPLLGWPRVLLPF